MGEEQSTTKPPPPVGLLDLLASWQPEAERIPEPEDPPPEPVCIEAS